MISLEQESKGNDTNNLDVSILGEGGETIAGNERNMAQYSSQETYALTLDTDATGLMLEDTGVIKPHDPEHRLCVVPK